MNYKQTKQFSEFHCIGNKCINNCCHDWKIAWTRGDVEKLRSAPGCSEKLQSLSQSVFEPSGDEFEVKLGGNGLCPFQLEDGLCIIQKEIGEGFLSTACAVFPRRYLAAGNTVFCSCSLSCPEVFRSLISEENSAVLLTLPTAPEISCGIDSAVDRLTPEELAEHSEFKYHKPLMEFFYEVISDKRFPTETNIVRGALAAEKLTETIASGGGKKIAGMITELREALCDDGVIGVIDSVQPEHEPKLKLLEVYTQSLFGSTLANLFRDGSGKPDIPKISHTLDALSTEFRNRPFWLRNIALNLLIELYVPFRIRSKTIYENYSDFAVIMSLIKICSMAAVLNEKISITTEGGIELKFAGEDRIPGLCSMILRLVNQNQTAAAVLSILFNSDKLTPRDIAMLVK